MLLSRIWTILLAATCCLAVAGVMLARETQVRTSEQATETGLMRDRGVVSLVMLLESRQRLAALARISADERVRTVLARPATLIAEGPEGDEARQSLRSHIVDLNRQMSEMAGEVIFAVDAQGTIVSQIGGDQDRRPAGAGVGRFPLVRQALRGFLRDDVWVYNGGVYTMVARPVIHGGRIVGAIAHGRALDRDFARTVARKLRGSTSLFFFRGDRILGTAGAEADGQSSSGGRVSSDAVSAALAARNVSDEEPDDGVVRVADDRGMAVFSPVIGGAAHAGVGFAVASTIPVVPPAFEMLAEAPEQDVAQLPVLPIAGGGLLVILLGLWFVWWERDRPMKTFERGVQALATRDVSRLEVSRFAGRFRTFAQHINEGLDHVGEHGTGRRAEGTDLDEVLGEEASESYFGFADIASRASVPAPPAFVDAVEKSANESSAEAMAPVRTEDLKTLPPEDFMTVVDQRPPEVPIKAPVPAPSTPDPEPEPAEAFQEGATVVASASPELIATTASDDVDPTDAHFRETYESYLTTREECGETISGITFERFRRTLTKNQDKILEQHPGSEIRFTVYVKNGRAALKAKRKQ